MELLSEEGDSCKYRCKFRFYQSVEDVDYLIKSQGKMFSFGVYEQILRGSIRSLQVGCFVKNKREISFFVTWTSIICL